MVTQIYISFYLFIFILYLNKIFAIIKFTFFILSIKMIKYGMHKISILNELVRFFFIFGYGMHKTFMLLTFHSIQIEIILLKRE